MVCRTLATVAALLAPLALTSAALASDITLYTVDSSQAETFVAGNSAGDYVINAITMNPCGAAAMTCYKVGNAKVPGYTLTTTLPTLPTPPLGSAPPSLDPPTTGYWHVTNSLGFLFAGEYDDGVHDIRGIFDGTDPFTDFLSNGSIEGGISAGSAVYFIDGINDTLVAAICDPTAISPEPATLTLLGTGLATLAGVARRRRIR